MDSSLLSHFNDLPDPRVDRTKRYALIEIIFLIIAATVMEKIQGKFTSLPNKMYKSITFDQGSEFADHRYIKEKMDCDVYYCEAHSPSDNPHPNFKNK